MKKTILFALILSFNLVQLKAQISGSTKSRENILTLQNCIETALQNNLQVKQNELTLTQQQVTYDESKFQLYPTVNGGTGFNLFSGRNINPYTNGIVTNTVGQNGFTVQGSMLLFDGKRTKNTIELNKQTIEASLYDLQTTKNNISLQVANAYLTILTQQDLLEVASKQIEVTKLQLERTEKRVAAGALPETNLYDLKAQLANDELSYVNAENNLAQSKLTMSQLLNYVDGRDFEITKVLVPDPKISAYGQSNTQVFEAAISFLPEVKAAETRRKIASKSMEIAKSSKLPIINLSGSIGTNYTTAAQQIIQTSETVPQNFGTVDFNGQKIPLIVNTPKQEFENINYFKQLTGNGNSNLGVNMQIPIFRGYNAKFRVENAKIQESQADLQIASNKLLIKQNIDQAFISLSNAQKRYAATQVQVESLEEAFRAATVRYDAGALNSVEYNIAKTNLDRAKTNLILSKYDYVFRMKILDFYQNKPLSF